VSASGDQFLYGDLAERLNHKIMVRLVKGTYWNHESRLQELGVERFQYSRTSAA
jgi:hypothetical protein